MIRFIHYNLAYVAVALKKKIRNTKIASKANTQHSNEYCNHTYFVLRVNVK